VKIELGTRCRDRKEKLPARNWENGRNDKRGIVTLRYADGESVNESRLNRHRLLNEQWF